MCDAPLQAMLLPRVEQEQALATAIEVCTSTLLFALLCSSTARHTPQQR
jgi:hypothetical protein